MWWCFADAGIHRLRDGTKIRKVLGKWHDTDINGRPLSLDSLSGKLIQIRGFRGTICSPKERDYVMDRINGKKSTLVVNALRAKQSLERRLIPLIENLTWGDFEIFVDLLFVGSGWKRVGVLGKTEKAWDLDLIAPVTGERAKVQVKSKASERDLLDCVREFKKLKNYQRMFFVVHSFSGKIRRPRGTKKIVVFASEELAERALDAGLSDWLIKKNS